MSNHISQAPTSILLHHAMDGYIQSGDKSNTKFIIITMRRY